MTIMNGNSSSSTRDRACFMRRNNDGKTMASLSVVRQRRGIFGGLLYIATKPSSRRICTLVFAACAFSTFLKPLMDFNDGTLATLRFDMERYESDFIRANDTVCNNKEESYGDLWEGLCKGNFVGKLMDMLYDTQEPVKILQIGAHTGWEVNDPFAWGITALLESLPEKMRRSRFEYTMIEASPTNYAQLKEQVKKHSSLCTFKTIHAGIVPETNGDNDLIFYAIKDTIDVHTGYDSQSRVKFPPWASQISSFDKKTLMKHSFLWRQNNLQLSDYIVETRVRTIAFNELLAGNTLFVLIDTEGLDCDIVQSMHKDATYLPPFLFYEKRHCNSSASNEYLRTMGYELQSMWDNVLARYNEGYSN